MKTRHCIFQTQRFGLCRNYSQYCAELLSVPDNLHPRTKSARKTRALHLPARVCLLQRIRCSKSTLPSSVFALEHTPVPKSAGEHFVATEAFNVRKIPGEPFFAFDIFSPNLDVSGQKVFAVQQHTLPTMLEGRQRGANSIFKFVERTRARRRDVITQF